MQIQLTSLNPPKVAAAYNTGGVYFDAGNPWRIRCTGNHIDRFVSAHNAYVAWHREEGGDLSAVARRRGAAGGHVKLMRGVALPESAPRLTALNLTSRAQEGAPPIAYLRGHHGSSDGVVLRPGDVGGIRQLLPLLRPVVRPLRARFALRSFAIRGRQRLRQAPLLEYAEYVECLYANGMPRNSKLEAQVEGLRQHAEQRWKESGRPVRLYTSFFYKGGAGRTRGVSRPK